MFTSLLFAKLLENAKKKKKNRQTNKHTQKKKQDKTKDFLLVYKHFPTI